jgi:hypothetical protein
MSLEQPRRNLWWIVLAVVVVLALVTWLLISRSRSDREEAVVAIATTETIAEGTVDTPSETGTIVELTETTATTVTTSIAQPPPPVIIEEQPPIAPDVEPVPPQPIREIDESEATSLLRAHLGASNPYDNVILGCLQIRSAGYSNVGFTFTVWDSCVPDGGTRLLGRWRIDAKTKEVFRQRDDGRYLRP